MCVQWEHSLSNSFHVSNGVRQGSVLSPAHLSALRVIPNQFNKGLHMTPSELDQSWYVCSTCGFMKPDKISLSGVVWFPCPFFFFLLYWLYIKC